MTIRPHRFVAGEQPDLTWYGDDPVASAFFTVLSLAFPSGERFFIETLTSVTDQLPLALAEEVRSFARQEANHAHQHLAFNRHLATAGYPTARLEQQFESRIAAASSLPPLLRIAFTAALEHVTAIIARIVLRDPRLFADVAPEIGAFWRWHAIEEIEHKAVAFDVYDVLAKTMSPLRRWQMRLRSIRAAARVMAWYAQIAGDLLIESGCEPKQAKRQLLQFLLLTPGLFRQCMPDLMLFLVPGFHPRWTNDSGLLAAAEHDAASRDAYPPERMRAISGL
jgi:hypothetical protein